MQPRREKSWTVQNCAADIDLVGTGLGFELIRIGKSQIKIRLEPLIYELEPASNRL